MIAGLPGTGIGGMFYAISAAFMPVKAIRSKKKRVDLMVRQILLSATVMATMWITGDIMGRLIALCVARGHANVLGGLVDPRTIASGKFNIITVPFLFWTVGAITVLHILIHGTRLAGRLSRNRQARRV